MGCTFCDIINRTREDYILWENNEFIVLPNIQTRVPGTCMLIPKKHIDYLFDMPDDLYGKFFTTAKQLEPALKEAMGAKRIGLLLSGFEIPHAHLFMIPLEKHGDHQKERKKLSKEELVQIQNTLVPFFEKIE